MRTHINWHTVIQPLPDHCLPLDVNVLSVLKGQSLDMFAVQVQRYRFGVHTEGNLMPAAVKEVVNFRVLEHSSDSILCQSNSVVLYCLVLTIQTDGNLTGQRKDLVNKSSWDMWKSIWREMQRKLEAI